MSALECGTLLKSYSLILRLARSPHFYMSGATFESDELQFCPICQVPLRILKIIFTIHVNMCDVLWDELPDCSDGIECSSESVFHYRDFSHKVLADHRENLRKRKIAEVDNKDDVNMDSESKENGKKVIKYQASEENEDNLFMPVKPKRVIDRRKSKTTKGSEKRKNDFKCIPRNQEIQENNPTNNNVCNVNETEENIASTHEQSISTENHFLDHEKNDLLTLEQFSMVHSENSESTNNDAGFEDTTASFESSETSTYLENLTDKMNETIKKKEQCKAQWTNLFKGNTSLKADVTPSKANKKKRSSMFGSTKEPKVCPSFKKMPGTSFAVDAFQFGDIPGVTTYFLTHFHADHYIGLRKSFSKPLYCSLITANLVKKKLRVQEKYLHVLGLNEPKVIDRVEVTCFDANHCPGAVLILFRLMNGEQFLHVGDFRACPEMESIPQLRNSVIDKLYLDTTYFNPDYVFPTQKEVVERVKDIVRNKSRKHEKALFISGTYSIGKEKVFIGMLEELQCKLWAQPQKVDIFRCVNDPVVLSALTSVPEEARVHVLPMNYLQFDRLKKHLLDLNGAFTHIFAFKPTGWEMGRRAGAGDWLNESSNSNITIYGVPYSEHSNYEELCRFINFIKADKVIPTVPMKNRQMYGILKSIVDSYKGGPKQQGIQRFFNSSS